MVISSGIVEVKTVFQGIAKNLNINTRRRYNKLYLIIWSLLEAFHKFLNSLLNTLIRSRRFVDITR